jgi:hypothetical protein
LKAIMRTRRVPLVLIMLLACLATAGCDRVMPAPGPVPLRNAAHMKTYLTGAEAWALPGDDGQANHFWSFAEDGTCRAWVIPSESESEPESEPRTTLAELIGLSTLPADATLITAEHHDRVRRDRRRRRDPPAVARRQAPPRDRRPPVPAALAVMAGEWTSALRR